MTHHAPPPVKCDLVRPPGRRSVRLAHGGYCPRYAGHACCPGSGADRAAWAADNADPAHGGP